MYNEDKKMPAVSFWHGGLGGFFKGVIWALCLTFLLLAICSVILTYTSVSEDIIPLLSLLCAAASVIVGGSMAAKSAVSRGYLKGACCGVIYILVLYLIASLISEKFIFTSHTALLFIMGVALGALGGIIGINSGSRRKR